MSDWIRIFLWTPLILLALMGVGGLLIGSICFVIFIGQHNLYLGIFLGWILLSIYFSVAVLTNETH